jgi:DNA-binding winged helix-turn-helix (wHTH) protein/Tol biopolymer transport system component
MNRRNKHLYLFGPFTFDPLEHLLLRDGKQVALPPKILETLLLLVKNAGHLVDKDYLLKSIWPDSFVEEGNLTKNIFVLRRTLGHWNGSQEYIETIPKHGYRFSVPVTEEGAPGPNLEPSRQATALAPALLEPKHDLSVGVGEHGPASHLTTTEKTGAYASKAAQNASKYRKALLLVACVLCVVIYATFRLRPFSSASLPRVTRFTKITDDGWPKAVYRIPVQVLFSDGARIYFQEIRDDRFVVSEVSVNGGQVVPLASPFPNTVLFDISPDKWQLLVGSGSDFGHPLWALPVPGGPPRRLGEISAHSACWSSNGTKLFFANDHDLYTATSDGNEIKKLLTIQGVVFSIRSAPDGRMLRFSVYDRGADSQSLWEVRIDGTGLHRLASMGTQQECCGAWIANGNYYLFQTSSRVGPQNLWVMDGKKHWLRNSGSVQLTNGPLSFISPQSGESPDHVYAIGSQPRSELMQYQTGYGFVPALGGIDAAGVSFSKDTQWITYTRTADSTLWRSKIDGSERVQLTFPPMQVLVPRWSPDRKQIAFMGQMPRQRKKALVISADGGASKELVPNTFMSEDPSWSPDGKAIVVSIVTSESDPGGIYILDSQSQTPSFLPGSTRLFSPRWSPDGKYIAALSQDEQTLMLFDQSRQQWTELAHMWIGFPSWSRDGRYIYFDSLGENPAFYRVRISDRKLEQIVSLKGARRLWSAWKPWSGLAPDDSLLVQHDISTEEIYALDLEYAP